MSIIRPIVRSIVRSAVSSIMGSVGAARDAQLEAVRNLDQSNGGDFAVSILDFGKASKRFADFDGTPAGEGDSVALVLDDVSDELGPDLVDQANDASAWNPQGSNTVEMDGGEVKITRVDSTNGAQINLGLTRSALVQTLTSGKWYRVTGNVRVSSGSTTLTINNGSGVGGPLSVTSTTLVPFHIDFLSDGAEAFRAKTNTSGMSVYVSGIEVKELPGAHAYQTTAASRPVVTTDALGRTPIETDGGDDRLDLPDGWLGDGTQHVHVFVAVSSDSWDAGDFRRLVTGAGDSLSGFGITTASGSNREKLRIATNGADAMYGREMSASEPMIIAGSAYPAGFAKLRLNGVEVGSDSTNATLDDPGAGALFNRTTGSRPLAATAWATVSVVGSRAMTEAEIRAVESYLAELADVTLAPQTRAEALTVLRRPATPASDLNVTENFDYADTAALLEVWTNTSTGDCTVTQDAANGWVALAQGASGSAKIGRTYRVRPGYKYRVSGQIDVSSDTGGLVQLRAGAPDTIGSVNVIAELSGGLAPPFGTPASLEYSALSSELRVEVIGYSTNRTRYLDFIKVEEVARTTAVYDMLDETRMTDSEGGTQALDAGVEILLPSVADDPYGPELATTTTTSGAFTGFQTILTQALTAPLGTMYRVSFTVDGTGLVSAFAGNSGSPNVRLGQGNLSSGTYVFFGSTAAGQNNQILWRGNPDFDGSITDISIKEVLHYPLQQSTEAAQPTYSSTSGALEFDGGDDFMQAVDPDGDLAITGDVTIVAAVAPDSTTATRVLVTSGDAASDNTDVAYAAMLDNAGKQRFDHASATVKESETNTQSSVVAGANTTLSWVRDGSSLTMAQDVTAVEVDSLSTTATAGAAPAILVGTRVTGSGQHFDGNYSGLAIYDGALPTGQVVVLESAMQKLSSGG